MRLFRLLVPMLGLASFCSAQLTKEQKLADFNQLAGRYAVNYGPYEEKRDVFGFDLYNLKPWIDQINQSKTDIEYYDICVKYVASLRDSHDEFTIPSDFDAWLHFDGDIYDGRFIIDFIDRTYLLRTKYPFTTGDELISVDGVPVADLLKQFVPYAVNGSSNPVSQKRLGAAFITERYQGWYPRAGEIGDNATIVVQRQTGATETYTVAWDISGTRLVNVGVIPTPQSAQPNARRSGPRLRSRLNHVKGMESVDDGSAPNPWGVWTGDPDSVPADVVPAYMAPLMQLQDMSALTSADIPTSSGLSPFGSLFPVFNPPAGFKLRLGSKSADQFLSGTFPVGQSTVGYIRIPTFSPSSTSVAVQQFASEIVALQGLTDGLVVDVMGNGGGSICYAETLTSYLIPTQFRGTSQELRATLSWRQSFDSSLARAKAANAPDWVQALYAAYLAEIDRALQENRGRTGGLPLCSFTAQVNPPTDTKGNVLSYTKPILVLTDNWTLSSAELFSMFLQDSGRATLFGTTTDGGGGNVVSFSAGAYSQAGTRVTEGLITRARAVAVPGFAASIYYDGVGIYPDVVQDYMTVDNLMTGGASFVAAFKDAIAGLIAAGK